jgi:hypothetical protein
MRGARGTDSNSMYDRSSTLMEGATQPEAGSDNGIDTRSQKEGRSVEKTPVIVFDDEAKAYGASHALEGLKQHGDVTLGLQL